MESEEYLENNNNNNDYGDNTKILKFCFND